MDEFITLEDVMGIFPRELLPEEEDRTLKLIERALDLIELEFIRAGRDLRMEMISRRDVQIAVLQAVTEMVSRAVLIGENAGRASVTSTTGSESDSVTFSQGIGIQWGSVGIDNAIRKLLGLMTAVLPRGGGGVVIPYGLTSPRGGFGAEFSERRRR